MNELSLARFLGWFSIGIGLTQLFAARPLARAIGLEGQEALVRGLGARELATGAYILSNPDDPAGLWGRVAGDAIDLAVLGQGLREPENQHDDWGRPDDRTGATIAVAAVAGIMILDVIGAMLLRRRDDRVLETARRTRGHAIEAGHR